MTRLPLFAATALAMSALGGCSIFSNDGPRTPNEFNVVTKPPLTVPPEYNLRPPGVGQTQPAEIDAARTDVATAFGTNIGANASASERALVAAAGANAVSPVIRAQVDYEQSRVLRKSAEASESILTAGAGATSESDSATGSRDVAIARGDERLKLPGT